MDRSYDEYKERWREKSKQNVFIPHSLIWPGWFQQQRTESRRWWGQVGIWWTGTLPATKKIHFKNQRKITTVLPCSLYIGWLKSYSSSVSTRLYQKCKVRSQRWFPYVLIRHSGPELGQTDHRVVRGLQVSERLAQEVLQSGHVRQGEVVRRRQRLSSGESQAEEEQPDKPCGQCHTLVWRSGEVLIHLVSPWKRDKDAF